VSFDLGSNRFVTVREFKGKKLVDIREFYQKDGKSLPGKKGISLQAGQFQTLYEIMDQVKEAIEKR
jgi:Transcriptional Coactivator p15 (PC4)